MAQSVSHFFQPKTKRFGEVDGFAKSEPGRPTLLDPMVAPPLLLASFSLAGDRRANRRDGDRFSLPSARPVKTSMAMHRSAYHCIEQLK
jgi:hypothetical protein